MTFFLDFLSFVLIESKINIFSTIKLKTGQKSAKKYLRSPHHANLLDYSP